MAHSRWSLPDAIRSVCLEESAALVGDCRDEIGVVDRDLLRSRVIAALREEAEVWEVIETVAPSIAVAQVVDQWLRFAKHPMVVNSRDNMAGERRARRMQRNVVTYRNDDGAFVTKEFRELTKHELDLLIQTEERAHAKHGEKINFYRATYAQMELLGLDDDALVGEVVDLAA